MNIDINDTQQRGLLYAIVSRALMKEADIEFLKLIKQDGIKEFFPNFLDWEVYKNSGDEKIIEEYLNIDFANTSLLHLIPYETFYERDDGMIDSGGENRALQFYDRFDFIVEKDKARVVSPDHIGVEFEFVHKLIEAQLEAQKADDKVGIKELMDLELEFLDQHLLKWAPIYLINVINEAETPFYHDAALMGLEYLLSDFEYLKEKCKN